MSVTAKQGRIGPNGSEVRTDHAEKAREFFVGVYRRPGKTTTAFIFYVRADEDFLPFRAGDTKLVAVHSLPKYWNRDMRAHLGSWTYDYQGQALLGDITVKVSIEDEKVVAETVGYFPKDAIPQKDSNGRVIFAPGFGAFAELLMYQRGFDDMPITHISTVRNPNKVQFTLSPRRKQVESAGLQVQEDTPRKVWLDGLLYRYHMSVNKLRDIQQSARH